MKFSEVIEKNNAKMAIGQFLKNGKFLPTFRGKIGQISLFWPIWAQKTEQYEFLKHYIWYRQTDGIPF